MFCQDLLGIVECVKTRTTTCIIAQIHPYLTGDGDAKEQTTSAQEKTTAEQKLTTEKQVVTSTSTPVELKTESTTVMPAEISTVSSRPLNPVITVESCSFEKDLCGFENSGFDFLGNYITPLMIRTNNTQSEINTDKKGLFGRVKL